MRTTLALLLGLVLAANGLFMLYDPVAWYGVVPGVPETGPLNAHFVRDVGCAYLVTGVAFVFFAFDGRALMAALAGGAFLALHALVHAADMIGGHTHSHYLLSDLAVFVPPLIALWLTLPAIHISAPIPLPTWLLRRQIAAFERAYDYDLSYAREILDADIMAFMAFARLKGLSQYRKGVPLESWYAAKLVGTLAEDCGPCTQLVVTMAERDGVAPALIKAVLTGERRAMSDDVALSMRFAKAAVAHDAGANDLRREIVQRWGLRGLVSLAFAITAARIPPTIKYALGHGEACRRVSVGGVPVPLLQQVA